MYNAQIKQFVIIISGAYDPPEGRKLLIIYIELSTQITINLQVFYLNMSAILLSALPAWNHEICV